MTSKADSGSRVGSPRVKWSPTSSRTVSDCTGATISLAPQREFVGRVIGQPMAALLRLQQQREGGIAADVDARDRVHLDGDVQFHGRDPSCLR